MNKELVESSGCESLPEEPVGTYVRDLPSACRLRGSLPCSIASMAKRRLRYRWKLKFLSVPPAIKFSPSCEGIAQMFMLTGVIPSPHIE